MEQQQLILKTMVRFRRMIARETDARQLSRLNRLLAVEHDKLLASRMAVASV
jgi:hypothetical protein